MFSKKPSLKKSSSSLKQVSTKKTPSPPRPQAPPKKIPNQLHHMRPSKMTGQLVPIKPPSRPTVAPTKQPSKTSPPKPTTGPTKQPSKTNGQMDVQKTGKTSVWDLFKKAQNNTNITTNTTNTTNTPPLRPTTGPIVKPTKQWSTFDNISLNEIRGYAQQYKNKSSQDIYNILIKKCSPEDSKKGVCKYDVEILSRIIHSYPLGKTPNAPQVQRAPNNKTPLNIEQKNMDKKFSDLLRHITHDYDLVYKASDIPVEQMLKRVNDLKTRLSEFKNASNDVKNSTVYKQRHAEYILLYKYIDTNKKILSDLVTLKQMSKQLEQNPNNNKLAKNSIKLFKQIIELNNSIPIQYRLLVHLNLKFLLESLVKNKLFANDPIFIKLGKDIFKKA